MTTIDRVKCFIKYKILKVSRPDPKEFWRKAVEGDSWFDYSKGEEKSEYLLTVLKRLTIDLDDPILEIGCNVGRNLNYLSKMGYTNLYGIKLSKEAVKMSPHVFPNMEATIVNSTIEDYLLCCSIKYKLIFSMAVLEHIPYTSDWIFNELSRHTEYILTIEDEKKITRVNFPRNYKKVFERADMIQMYVSKTPRVHPAFYKGFYTRIFSHI